MNTFLRFTIRYDPFLWCVDSVLSSCVFDWLSSKKSKKASTTTRQGEFELRLGRSGPSWSICIVLNGVVSSSPPSASGASCKSCLFVTLVWSSMQSSSRYTIHFYLAGQKKYCLRFSKFSNIPNWPLWLWVWANGKSGMKSHKRTKILIPALVVSWIVSL